MASVEKKKENVKYEFLGNSGLKVSNICLGTMTFGTSEGMFGFFKNPKQCDEKLSHEIMDRYAELGGNFIDTANVYSFGNSEEIIGNWLKKQDRDRFVIATKCRFPMAENNPNSGGLSRRNIVQSLEASLDRLKLDYVDLYQTHMWDPAVPIEETLRTLHDLVRCGKVRYLGCSNVVGWQLQKIMDVCKYCGLTPMISLQQQYSLLCRHSELEEFHVCRNEGIGVIPWSPLKSGMLTGKFKRDEQLKENESRIGFISKKGGVPSSWSIDLKDDRYWNLIDTMRNIGNKHGKSIPQVALRWILQKDVIPSVIIGATSVKQLEDNMGAAAGWEMTSQEMKSLDTASAMEVPYPYSDIYGAFNSDRINPFHRSMDIDRCIPTIDTKL